MPAVDDAHQPSSVLPLPSAATSLPRRHRMGRSWAKVSVVAIALAALVGCSSDPEPSDAQDDGRQHCNLVPNVGFYVTVKGTAQYTTEVTGDAVVGGIG